MAHLLKFAHLLYLGSVNGLGAAIIIPNQIFRLWIVLDFVLGFSLVNI